MGKMFRIDHILLTPNLLHAEQSIKHQKVGSHVSDHAAVVMHLDWSHANVGKGVFRCGPNTNKDLNYYQKSIHKAFLYGLLDFIEDETKAKELRLLLDTCNDRFVNRVQAQINNFILYGRDGSGIKTYVPSNYLVCDV